MRLHASRSDILNGTIWKQILIFFFPILFGTFFQQLYNTVDAVIVGNFVGKEALGAVGGSTGTLINLLVGFVTGISSGATVVISQFYGRRDADGVSRSVYSGMFLAVAVTILFSESTLIPALGPSSTFTVILRETLYSPSASETVAIRLRF